MANVRLRPSWNGIFYLEDDISGRKSFRLLRLHHFYKVLCDIVRILYGTEYIYRHQKRLATS